MKPSRESSFYTYGSEQPGQQGNKAVTAHPPKRVRNTINTWGRIVTKRAQSRNNFTLGDDRRASRGSSIRWNLMHRAAPQLST